MEKEGVSVLEAAVLEITWSNYPEIEKKYGRGKKDGLDPKEYHNMEHAKDLVQAAREIARLAAFRGKITEDDILLVCMAASFEDYTQEFDEEKNKAESAR